MNKNYLFSLCDKIHYQTSSWSIHHKVYVLPSILFCFQAGTLETWVWSVVENSADIYYSQEEPVK